MIKKFHLFGEEIDVILTDKLENNNGACDADKNIIYLCKNLDNDYQNATFFHELTHMILLKLDETALSNDEKFVTKFSGLLHQFIATAKEGKK
jgi:Zn-dependent peptidase ImmA (M78 family)